MEISNLDLCIYKYPLEINGEQGIDIVEGAKFLCVKEQHNLPVLYYLVYPSITVMQRKIFRILGTGHPMSIRESFGLKYLDSVVCNNGQLVWHVFEKQF